MPLIDDTDPRFHLGYPQPQYQPQGIPARAPQGLTIMDAGKPPPMAGQPPVGNPGTFLQNPNTGGRGFVNPAAAQPAPVAQRDPMMDAIKTPFRALANLYRGDPNAAAPDFGGAMGANDFGSIANLGAPTTPGAPAAQNTLTQMANAPIAGAGRGVVNPPMANPNVPIEPVTAPLGGGPVQDGLRLGTVQGGLSSADRLGQMERDYASMRDLNAAKAAQLAKTDAPPGMALIGNPGPEAAQKFFDEANLRNAAAKGSWSPRGGYKGDDAAVAAAAVPITNRAKLAELSLRNAGDQSIAAMRDKTDRRGQDLQAQTASLRDQTDRRGQDVTARGQDMTAKSAAAAARADQMNKDRQYGLDVKRMSVDDAKTAFEQREKSRERTTSQIAGMLPPGADGKPDTAAAARYTDGLQSVVAERQMALERQLAKTPDRADVKAELAALERDPYGTLGQDNIRKFMAGQKATGLAQAGKSWVPGVGSDMAHTSAPIASLKADNGLFGTDYIATHANGSTSTVPGRAFRKDGKFDEDLRHLITK